MKGSYMVESQLVSALQVFGWILRLTGQVQVARRRRAGSATWVAAMRSLFVNKSLAW